MIYCESCGYSEDNGLWNLKLWCKKWKISVYPDDMDCGSGIRKDNYVFLQSEKVKDWTPRNSQ